MRADGVAQVLQAARRAGTFTAVAAEVGSSREPQWTWADGHVTDDAASGTVTSTTMFDLASLTKVLVTTTLAAGQVATGRLSLDSPLTDVVAGWNTLDRTGVKVRDCFEHCTGLPAHRPYFQTISGRDAYQAAISREPLEYLPRTRELYSDLDFILLGFIIADVGAATLAQQFDDWKRFSGLKQESTFIPADGSRSRVAGTGYDSWRGRKLQGEVHDQNAAALGGLAGHAGLFGTAAAVGEIARWWMAHLPQLKGFVQRSAVPNSSRALGWDTMLLTSSCGNRMSSRAFGHTGFTGTSLWIDPAHDLYAVLLTNFVQNSNDRSVIRNLRRAFHDAVMTDLRL